MPHPIYLIAAVDKNFGIGKKGDLPWRIKDDLLFFQKTTTETKNPKKQNMVIMGRKTWESLPEKHRPLSSRKNIILTNQTEYRAKGAEVSDSLENALSTANETIESIFVIGGGNLYHQAINYPEISGVYLTHINAEFDCDTFFPHLPKSLSTSEIIGEGEENGIHFEYILHKPNLNTPNTLTN